LSRTFATSSRAISSTSCSTSARIAAEFAQGLRREGYRGQIHSFEPGSEAFAALAELAGKDARWEAHPYALGAEATQRSLHVAATGDLSSFLEPSPFGTERFAALGQRTQELVEVRTLEEVLPELCASGAEVMLKLDTQGFDLAVFEGLGSALPRVRAMSSELSLVPLYEGMPHYLEVLARYEAAAFRVSGFYPVCRERESLALIEVDCVLVRDEA
tara:strand:- start:113 stop:760 length:648 start_codon:yes stop_codon:yes gene_type:complete